MTDSRVKGDANIVAGRDVVLQRVIEAARTIDLLPDLFSQIDQRFCAEISPDGLIQKGDREHRFSSEALFTSLVTIGIPVLVAIKVPDTIIPILRIRAEQLTEADQLTTSDVKSAVLQVLQGLQFYGLSKSSDEVSTWCSAYVRRYGTGSEFLQVVDRGEERALNYDYVKDVLLPHVLGNIIGVRPGVDVITAYPDVFSANPVKRMANEIIKLANSLNVYSIRYKTLYMLVSEVMLQPPHPWIVSAGTMNEILRYNLERADAHFSFLEKQKNTQTGAQLMASLRECVVHLCAAILSRYGCLLGVEARYGLIELNRLIQLKTEKRNLTLWEYCEFNLIERDLDKCGISLKGFHLFLERMIAVTDRFNPSEHEFSAALGKCSELVQITGYLLSDEVRRRLPPKAQGELWPG